MYKFSDDPIFLLEQTKYGQFLKRDKNIYEGHKKLKDIFDEEEVSMPQERNGRRNEMLDEIKRSKKQNNLSNKNEKRLDLIKIFLLVYWRLLVFGALLTVFLIISVILYTRCHQDRSQDNKLEVREIKLDTTTSYNNLPTSAATNSVWWQTIRPTVPAVVTYFPAELSNNFNEGSDQYDAASGYDCPLTLYMIMIILSSLGLVFVIALGFGAAIFNKV